MRYCVLVLASAALASGCLIDNMAPERRLKDSVQRVNDGMRWSRMDVALPHVEQDYRTRFMRTRQDWGSGINIADTEIIAVEVSEETPDEATSVVAVRWYSKSNMRLFETRIEQSWKHGARGKGYQLVGEEIVGGNPTLMGEGEARTSGGESAAGEGAAGEGAADETAKSNAAGAGPA